jgi:hypothetical protein
VETGGVAAVRTTIRTALDGAELRAAIDRRTRALATADDEAVAEIVAERRALRVGKQTREEVVADAAKGLKTLAVRLGVPVLCAAALNRQATAEHRRPEMRDLRESGASKYDAEGIWLLHRDDYVRERKGSSGSARRRRIAAVKRPASYLRALTASRTVVNWRLFSTMGARGQVIPGSTRRTTFRVFASQVAMST